MKTLAAIMLSFCLCAPALAQGAEPRRIVTSIMHEAGDTAAYLDGVRDGELVYLDLLYLELEGACGQGHGPLAVAGEYLTLPRDGAQHMIARAVPGAPEAFPFNLAACEYAPTLEGMAALRLRGFYAALITGAPTARMLLLHPVRLGDAVAESAIAMRGPPDD
ncbi:MAG: hypothetical protein KIS81_04895 [Maricaulaceae bacterium]|nr:hypothetical protein [Maricaulaceae bacterium]